MNLTRHTPLALASLSLFLLGGCMSHGYRTYDPRYGSPSPDGRAGAPAADVAAEMGQLVDELASRAQARTSLGSVRVVVDDLVPLQPRKRRYRQAALEREATADTEATLRHELEMTLAGYMNVVGGTVIREVMSREAAPGVESGEDSAAPVELAERARQVGASHAVIGTFQRDGRAVEVSLQLVELRSEWLVATARRRIENFEPESFGRAVVDPGAGSGRQTAAAERTEPMAPVPTVALRGGLARPADEARAVDRSLDSEPQSIPVPDRVANVADAAAVDPGEAEVAFKAGPAAARLRALDPRLLEPQPNAAATDSAGAAPATDPEDGKLPD